MDPLASGVTDHPLHKTPPQSESSTKTTSTARTGGRNLVARWWAPTVPNQSTSRTPVRAACGTVHHRHAVVGDSKAESFLTSADTPLTGDSTVMNQQLYFPSGPSSDVDQLMGLADWHRHSLDVSHVTDAELHGLTTGTFPEDGLSNGDSHSGNDDESLPSTATPKKRAKRSVNASRERRKQELAYLRQLVCDLEGQLGALQERREELLRPHLAGDTGALVTIAPVWESLAKRQFQARKKAEQETTRLKTLLAAQAQVADDLINVIQRAREIQQDAFGLLQSANNVKDHESRVKDQLERLRILCGQWFVAFSWHSQHLQTGPLRFFETKVVSDDGRETVLDIYSTQTFPFPVAQVENAIWTIFQAECDEDEYAYVQSCKASEDTLIGKFTAASLKNGAPAALKGTYVTRRFRNEQGQFLMATNVHATPDVPGGLYPESDYVLTEDTWVRILDAKEVSGVIASLDSTPTLTVLQHVRRSRVRFTNPDHPGDTRVQTLMKLHLSLIEEELRWGQQSIESMLMRGASTC